MNKNIPITMDKNFRLSIITVNLDNLEGLKRTMQSVFDQTWQEFEYIIIDGGSKDGSKEYIQGNSEKIDYWVSEPDNGIYNAMNKGIGMSSGDYLFFLNSGDRLAGSKILEEITPQLENYDVYYGNLIKEMQGGEKKRDKGPKGYKITLNTFFNGTINHSASFIKRNLFEQYGLYDEKLKIVSDWKFFLIAVGMSNSKVKYLDYDISYFNMEGISNRNIPLRDKEREQVLKDKIPHPIYNDYLELNELKGKFSTYRTRMFFKGDSHKLIRKINSLIFRFISLK